MDLAAGNHGLARSLGVFVGPGQSLARQQCPTDPGKASTDPEPGEVVVGIARSGDVVRVRFSLAVAAVLGLLIVRSSVVAVPLISVFSTAIVGFAVLGTPVTVIGLAVSGICRVVGALFGRVGGIVGLAVARISCVFGSTVCGISGVVSAAIVGPCRVIGSVVG